MEGRTHRSTKLSNLHWLKVFERLMPLSGTVIPLNVMTTLAAPSKCLSRTRSFCSSIGFRIGVLCHRPTMVMSNGLSVSNPLLTKVTFCWLRFRILLSKVIETGYDDTQWSLTNNRNGKSSGTLKLILHYAGARTVSSCLVSETRAFRWISVPCFIVGR
jgi:hypothetical protein